RRELFDHTGRSLFHPTGVLWLADHTDPHLQGIWELLQRLNAKCEKLSGDDVRKRYPQLHFEDVTLGVLEPESGVLMARQAVQALTTQLMEAGVEYYAAAVVPPQGEGKLVEIKTSDGKSISAGTFVFASVAWY